LQRELSRADVYKGQGLWSSFIEFFWCELELAANQDMISFAIYGLHDAALFEAAQLTSSNDNVI